MSGNGVTVLIDMTKCAFCNALLFTSMENQQMQIPPCANGPLNVLLCLMSSSFVKRLNCAARSEKKNHYQRSTRETVLSVLETEGKNGMLIFFWDFLISLFQDPFPLQSISCATISHQSGGAKGGVVLRVCPNVWKPSLFPN